MLLTILLLAQFFIPAQEQQTAATTSPVEVFDFEVRMYEVRRRSTPPPSVTPPSGARTNGDVNKARTPGAVEQQKIDRRSRELAGIRTATAPPPVIGRPSGGYGYEYRMRVKNISPKKIKSILWEYQVTDGSGNTIISQRLFLCTMMIKSGSDKLLRAASPSPPNRVVSADTSDEQSQKQKVVINRIEYSDGSTWIREAWKPNDLTRDETTKGKDLRDGQCTPL